MINVLGVETTMEVVPEVDDDAAEAAALEAAMAMSMGGEALTATPASASASVTAPGTKLLYLSSVNSFY